MKTQCCLKSQTSVFSRMRWSDVSTHIQSLGVVFCVVFFLVSHIITYSYSTQEKTSNKTDEAHWIIIYIYIYAVHFCHVIFKGITWLQKCLDLPVVTFLVYFMIAIAALQPNMRAICNALWSHVPHFRLSFSGLITWKNIYIFKLWFPMINVSVCWHV